MAYQIFVNFASSLPTSALIERMQSVYDNNGVDGTFTIQRRDATLPHQVLFHRETRNDIDLVHARLPSGFPVTDGLLAAAAGKQLLAELSLYEGDVELAPLFEALRSGSFSVKNVHELRLPQSQEPVKLRLFEVTLDWNPNDSAEGDYQSKTWAVDEAAAIQNVAEEMAGNRHWGEDAADQEDCRRFIRDIVAGAGPFSAAPVDTSLVNDVQEFLRGPEQVMTPEIEKDLATVKAILAKYGAVI